MEIDFSIPGQPGLKKIVLLNEAFDADTHLVPALMHQCFRPGSSISPDLPGYLMGLANMLAANWDENRKYYDRLPPVWRFSVDLEIAHTLAVEADVPTDAFPVVAAAIKRAVGLINDHPNIFPDTGDDCARGYVDCAVAATGEFLISNASGYFPGEVDDEAA